MPFSEMVETTDDEFEFEFEFDSSCGVVSKSGHE